MDTAGNTLNLQYFKPLDFKGQIDFPTHEQLIDSVKDIFKNHFSSTSVKNRAIHIIIECLENIYKHSEFFDSEKVYDTFSLSLNPDSIFLTFSNPVTKERMLKIKERFEDIEKCSISEIKTKYNEQLRTQTNFNEKGAGLGILRISLLSNNKIKYNFDPISENSYYFRLFITIDTI